MGRRIDLTFEGAQLPSYELEGRPFWVAADVARVLGYERTDRLASSIAGDWSDDFEEGVEFDKLTGKNLRDFKSLIEPTTDSVVGRRASSVLVLYESGVYAATQRTNKPVGRALRRWLSREVLPAFRRGELAVVEAPAQLPPAPAPAPRPLSGAALRERRRNLEFELDYIERWGAVLGSRPDAVVAEQMSAFKRVTGHSYGGLLSKTTKATGKLWSATDIAREVRRGVTASQVGKYIAKLCAELGVSREEFADDIIAVPAANADRNVDAFRYTEEKARRVVKFIIDERDRGGGQLELV